MKSTWVTAKLGDYAELITKGTTPKTLGRDYCTQGVGFVRAENLRGGWVDLASIDLFIDDETDNLLSRSRILPGDVLITIAGTIGRTGVVPKGAGRLNSNQAVALVRLKSHLGPRFLEYWLRAGDGRHQIAGGKVTQNIPNLSLAQIGSLVVPVPTLREQARIVELLDQADALCRQRADADAKLARLLPALFRHHFGDPVEGAQKLEGKPLGSLLSSIDSGDSPRCLDRQARPDEWSVLKLGAVTWGRFDDSQNKALPGDLNPDPSLEVRAGDLLFSRKNTLELVGATALVRNTRSKLLLPDLIFRLVPRDDAKITKEYLWCLLSQPSMRSRLRSIASGAAGSMPNISKGRLEGIEIPRPPLETQRTFSRQVHAALDVETQAAASAAQLETLFQNLLHRAFTGELTAKWREAHLREGVQEMSRLSRP